MPWDSAKAAATDPVPRSAALRGQDPMPERCGDKGPGCLRGWATGWGGEGQLSQPQETISREEEEKPSLCQNIQVQQLFNSYYKHRNILKAA